MNESIGKTTARATGLHIPQANIDRFDVAVERIMDARVEAVYQRVMDDISGHVWYIGGPLPASAEDEAKHAAIMAMNVKPKGMKSFAEWRAEQEV